ncbi:ergothioneine biosynthesis glutamate--cysteine ligase EgtA [Lipingzhangella sp. LS1_29]|uniref:Glutamate--cysteine ligase EgtA n=1 Tax=Lipingzhangella rawalii TaxID=2055835 RepID=A0ABU2H8K0_9ACTN|nr:ergothioneine biosynthesis glutamate--cysteine ligase EgtA [Lipingzhangella rawalii]MDS1271636.1 ergothioneine biosynthesis glutamate--cysteine ligase EgtA [Lipingzhangella rawalii]
MVRLTEDDVHEYVTGICFKTGPPGRVGCELEWHVVDRHQPAEPVPLHRLARALTGVDPPPAGSTLTYEPGGQLELSSLPHPDASATHAALSADLAAVEAHLGEAGLRLHGGGLHPARLPARQLSRPRYRAMERYFDRDGAAGRTMMCATASMQVCVDIGANPADLRRRWSLLHQLTPVLIAAFANSAVWRGQPTGWRSARQLVWATIDATRTRPVAGPDPRAAWARYALDARLLAIRETHRPWQVNPGLRFRDWLSSDRHRHPTQEDLSFHLSTLFPPVRPRGWFELRVIDAPPRAWWPVPLAVVSALVDDPIAADTARAATERLARTGRSDHLWLRACRDALHDPHIAACARACFEATRAALHRAGAATLASLVDAYTERFVDPGRCPADEHLQQRALSGQRGTPCPSPQPS